MDQLHAQHRLFNQAGVLQEVDYQGNRYWVFIADARTHRIQVFYEINGQHIQTIERLKRNLDAQGKSLLFATNGAIFDLQLNPLGLLMVDGTKLFELNTAVGQAGNFFLQPNGVFYTNIYNRSQILETQRFRDTRLPKADQKSDVVRMALQSGPLLLRSGQINAAFSPTSSNWFTRSGVGVFYQSELSHFTVFALSLQPVTLHEFATFFKEKIGCYNALYLDGNISTMYAPLTNAMPPQTHYATIIGVLPHSN